VTWSTTTAWNAIKTGPKHATVFCMTANLCYCVYQGVWGWICGLASELELAHSDAVHLASFPKAGHHGARASERAKHFALQTPTSTSQQAKKRFWSTL
jgi:hypothetical protein